MQNPPKPAGALVAALRRISLSQETVDAVEAQVLARSDSPARIPRAALPGDKEDLKEGQVLRRFESLRARMAKACVGFSDDEVAAAVAAARTEL